MAKLTRNLLATSAFSCPPATTAPPRGGPGCDCRMTLQNNDSLVKAIAELVCDESLIFEMALV